MLRLPIESLSELLNLLTNYVSNDKIIRSIEQDKSILPIVSPLYICDIEDIKVRGSYSFTHYIYVIDLLHCKYINKQTIEYRGPNNIKFDVNEIRYSLKIDYDKYKDEYIIISHLVSYYESSDNSYAKWLINFLTYRELLGELLKSTYSLSHLVKGNINTLPILNSINEHINDLTTKIKELLD